MVVAELVLAVVAVVPSVVVVVMVVVVRFLFCCFSSLKTAASRSLVSRFTVHLKR